METQPVRQNWTLDMMRGEKDDDWNSDNNETKDILKTTDQNLKFTKLSTDNETQVLDQKRWEKRNMKKSLEKKQQTRRLDFWKIKGKTQNHYEKKNSNQSVDIVKCRTSHTGLQCVIIFLIMFFYCNINGGKKNTFHWLHCQGEQRYRDQKSSQMLQTQPVKCVSMQKHRFIHLGPYLFIYPSI